MSHLNDLGNTLALKLTALLETERAEFIAFVKTEVLTSYRNGLRDATKERPSRQTSERSQATPTRRRNYQHR